MGTFMPLKHYFGKELALRLAGLIQPVYPDFDSDQFVRAVERQVEPLELKARVRVIADELHRAIPLDYPDQIAVLLGILGPENENERGMFTEGYFLMPVADFVERYGLDHFRISMDALYEITKRHTSEYAIRPYLRRYPEVCMEMLEVWSRDANFHVRRLVSEGTRPRLPWAKRMDALMGDPLRNLALLEPLRDDASAYVRRSVANHLNDLTRDHRQVTLCWIAEKLNAGWAHGPGVVRRALRTLVKRKDPDALAIIRNLP